MDPSDGGLDGRGRKVLIVVWTLLTISTVILSLRLYVKLTLARKLWWDDYMLVFAEMFGYVHAAMVTLSVKNGLGYHMWLFKSHDQLAQCLRWLFASFGPAFVSPTFGRISFCLFLLSIVWHSARIPRWPLYFCIVVQILVNGASVVIIYGECGGSLSAVWDLNIPVILAKCWPLKLQSYWGYAAGSVNAVTDLFLTLLPITMVSLTSLSTKARLGIISLLCLSLLAMCACIKKTLEAKVFSEFRDYTYIMCDYVGWSAIEINVVIIASTIPLLRPLFQRRRGSQELPSVAPAPELDTPPRPVSVESEGKHGDSAARTLSICSEEDTWAEPLPPMRPLEIIRTVEVSVQEEAAVRSAAHAALMGIPLEDQIAPCP